MQPGALRFTWPQGFIGAAGGTAEDRPDRGSGSGVRQENRETLRDRGRGYMGPV